MLYQTLQRLFSTYTTRVIGVLYCLATIHFLSVPLLNLENTFHSYSTALYIAAIPIITSITALFIIYSATKNYIQLSSLHKSAVFFIVFLFFSGFASFVFFIYNIDLQMFGPTLPVVDLCYIVACFSLVFAVSYYINGIEKPAQGIRFMHTFFVIAPAVFLFLTVFGYSLTLFEAGHSTTGLVVPILNVFYIPTVLIMIVFVIRFMYMWFSKTIKSHTLFASVVLSVGFLILYSGDLLLALAKSVNIFYIGNWNDFIFLTAFSVLSLFLLYFIKLLKEEKL